MMKLIVIALLLPSMVFARVLYYSTPEEREALRDDATSKGEMLRHDDFLDAAGNPTQSGKGRLTFVTPVPLTLADRKLATRRARGEALHAQFREHSDMTTEQTLILALDIILGELRDLQQWAEGQGMTKTSRGRAFDQLISSVLAIQQANPLPTQ